MGFFLVLGLSAKHNLSTQIFPSHYCQRAVYLFEHLLSVFPSSEDRGGCFMLIRGMVLTVIQIC